MYKTQSATEKPEHTRVGRSTAKYPFTTMAVGEMFFAPDAKSQTLAPYAAKQGIWLGRKFSTRTLTMRKIRNGSWAVCDRDHPKAVRGVGVWRDK